MLRLIPAFGQMSTLGFSRPAHQDPKANYVSVEIVTLSQFYSGHTYSTTTAACAALHSATRNVRPVLPHLPDIYFRDLSGSSFSLYLLPWEDNFWLPSPSARRLLTLREQCRKKKTVLH